MENSKESTTGIAVYLEVGTQVHGYMFFLSTCINESRTVHHTAEMRYEGKTGPEPAAAATGMATDANVARAQVGEQGGGGAIKRQAQQAERQRQDEKGRGTRHWVEGRGGPPGDVVGQGADADVQ